MPSDGAKEFCETLNITMLCNSSPVVPSRLLKSCCTSEKACIQRTGFQHWEINVLWRSFSIINYVCQNFQLNLWQYQYHMRVTENLQEEKSIKLIPLMWVAHWFIFTLFHALIDTGYGYCFNWSWNWNIIFSVQRVTLSFNLREYSVTVFSFEDVLFFSQEKNNFISAPVEKRGIKCRFVHVLNYVLTQIMF